MRKILSVLLSSMLIFALLISLTACGGDGKIRRNDESDEPQATEEVRASTDDEKIKATIKKLELATNASDIDSLLSCYAPAVRYMYELSLKALDSITGIGISDILNALYNSGIASEVISVQITVTDIQYNDGNSATVSCLFEYKNPNGENEKVFKFIMIKNSDEWYISSDVNDNSSTGAATSGTVITPAESNFVTSAYLNGVKIDKYNGVLDNSKMVIFPDKINGKNVTAVDAYACQFSSGKVQIPVNAEIISPNTDFEFFERGGALTITAYIGTSAKAGVPAQIDGVPVFAVGDSAFGSGSINEVTVAEGVEKLYECAFKGVAENGGIVHVPSTVATEWSEASFANLVSTLNANLLKHAVICVRSGSEFQERISETKEEVARTLFSIYTVFTSRDGNFYYNEFSDYVQITGYVGDASAEVITIPNEYNGKPVIDLYREAFKGCEAKKITLPDKLEYIGQGCFYECTNLEDIELPQSLICLKPYAFSDCKAIEKIHIYGNCRVVPTGCFQSCTSLTDVIIDEGLELLSFNAFENDVALISITIPASASRLSDDNFSKQICAKYLCVYGKAGSVAQSFANFHGCEFEEK